MSLAKYLEKASIQKSGRLSYRKFSDEERLNIVESILYSAFHRKKLNNLNSSKLPTNLFEVDLDWQSDDGTVELISGPLKRVRNFNSTRKGPSGSIGEFVVKKSAFGSGVLPELRVKKGETRILKSGIKHDYKKIYIEEGGRIISDNENNMLILLASEELVMEDRSRIEWIGKKGTSDGNPNTDLSLNGSPAPYSFDFYNGDYSTLEKTNILNGEDGAPGTAGESAGIIYIEAKKMRMAPTAAIRSIGGDGGSSPDGNGAGGNGGGVIIKTQIGINIELKKLAVTGGKSAGYDGYDGIKDVEFLQ